MEMGAGLIQEWGRWRLGVLLGPLFLWLRHPGEAWGSLCLCLLLPHLSRPRFPRERPLASSFRVAEHSWHLSGTESQAPELMVLGVTQVLVDNWTLGHLISKTQLSEFASPCKARTELTALKFHTWLLVT